MFLVAPLRLIFFWKVKSFEKNVLADFIAEKPKEMFRKSCKGMPMSHR